MLKKSPPKNQAKTIALFLNGVNWPAFPQPPVITRAVLQSWGTSDGTFVTAKEGAIMISFLEYSNSKKAHLQPWILWSVV